MSLLAAGHSSPLHNFVSGAGRRHQSVMARHADG